MLPAISCLLAIGGSKKAGPAKFEWDANCAQEASGTDGDGDGGSGGGTFGCEWY